MLVAEWKNESALSATNTIGEVSDETLGWSNPMITKYQGLTLPPSASVFHYGLEVV